MFNFFKKQPKKKASCCNVKIEEVKCSEDSSIKTSSKLDKVVKKTK